MGSNNRMRSPLHERTNSDTNAVPLRIVPPTPPQLSWTETSNENPVINEESAYERSALPTRPSHLLPPLGKAAPFLQESEATSGSADGYVSGNSSSRSASGQGFKSGAKTPTQAQTARQNLFANKATPSSSKPASIRSLPRKRRQVRINADKTFSVVSLEGVKSDDDLPQPEDEVSSPSSLDPAGQLSQNRLSNVSISTDGFSPRTESSNSWRSGTTNTTITAGLSSRHNSYLNTYGSDALHLQDFGRSSPLSSELSSELLIGNCEVGNTIDVKGKEPAVREPLRLMTALTSERGPRPDLSAAAEVFPSEQSTPTTELASDRIFPSSPPDLRNKARSSTNSSDQDSPQLPPLPIPTIPSSPSSEKETGSRGTNSRGTGSQEARSQVPSRGASSHVSDGTVIHHDISHSSSVSYRDTSQPAQTSSSENAHYAQRRLSPFSDENVVVYEHSSSDTGSEDANYEVLGPTSQPAHNTTSITYQRYSTPSLEPNYEILGFTSPPDRHHQRALSATPNYEIHGRTSQPASTQPSPTRRFASDSSYPNYDKTSPVDSVTTSPVGSINNYDIHHDYSQSTSTMQLPAQPRSAYSRESLLIPPLQPKAQRSDEGLSYYKQHSRESLRSTSMTSAISSYADDFARAVAGGKPLTRIPSLKNIPETETGSTSWLGSLNWGSNHKASSKSWSGALSTVPSGSDADYSGRTSRQLDYRRKSTGLNTLHSVQTTDSRLSSSSGIPVNDRAETDSLEFPRPSYALGLREQRDPSVSTTRLIDEHEDEHDDKITDIPVLQERPSRARISGYRYNDHERSNSMRSMGSSRSNSLIGSALPSWARVYYGSGERRFLGAPVSTTDSGSTRNNSRNNSMRSGSPDANAFPQIIISARRRPRDSEMRHFPGFSMHSRRQSDRSGRSSRFSMHSYSRSRSHSMVPSDYQVSVSEPSNGESSRHSMDIRVVESSTNPRPSTQYSAGVGHTDAGLSDEGGRVQHSFMHRARKPSSTWSPHLQLDKRADPRQNDWEMHSVEWSQGGLSSRRNRQIILFVIGFVLPPSWFLASFLPLPERAVIPDMREEGHMRSRRELMMEMNAFWSPMDEKRLQSARWWRILNRIFSVAGVVILVLVVSFSALRVWYCTNFYCRSSSSSSPSNSSNS